VVFWFFRFSCVFLGFLILVIRRFGLLNIGKTTNLPLRLQWYTIQTPKWHAVPFFLKHMVDE